MEFVGLPPQNKEKIWIKKIIQFKKKNFLLNKIIHEELVCNQNQILSCCFKQISHLM
jgi:hypothetical protein